MTATETDELVARARDGDREPFGRLAEPYRRELEIHCYRILASVQDAENAVQEVLLAAWQSLAGFEQRASIRTWLYRIATNRCLNHLRDDKRRPDVHRALPPLAPDPTGSVRCCGSSPTRMPSSAGLLTARPARRPATRPPRRSRSTTTPTTHKR